MSQAPQVNGIPPTVRPAPSLYSEAVRYVSNGLVVLPVAYFNDDYRTNVPWKDRTETTQAELETWFATGAYTGMALRTGSRFGFFVLDIDVKNENGFASLAEYGIDPWTLSPTMAQTPSGGLHVYFQTDKSIANKTGWLPGVDIRGDGGLIYAPPSVRKDGIYSWVSSC